MAKAGVQPRVDADVDAELMDRVARGDRSAFAQLFDRHQASVCRFAFRYVGDRAKAEELAQEIFVKLYKSAPSYRPTARFKTFLFRVAANHCLNEVRRGEYRVSHETTEGTDETERPLDVAAPPGEGPEETLQARELERAVSAALGELSDRERAAFTMCRFEGMAYRDIASALSATEAAVKSLIHRATLAVARKLSSLEAGLSPARSRA